MHLNLSSESEFIIIKLINKNVFDNATWKYETNLDDMVFSSRLNHLRNIKKNIALNKLQNANN